MKFIIIKSKIQTFYWFFKRPEMWSHAYQLFLRKFKTNYDSFNYRVQAIEWCEKNHLPTEVALLRLNIPNLTGRLLKIDNELINSAMQNYTLNYNNKMGGAGHIDLLYTLVKILNPKNIIETGVAYGWSSLGILAGINDNKSGFLISIDMPYPKLNYEHLVGIIIPQPLKESWKLIRKPDRNGLVEGLQIFSNKIDFAHYDSDKSWWGREFAYPLIWNSLNQGGLLVSDDIEDNLYFKHFSSRTDAITVVLKFHNKYIGIMRKT